MPRTSADQRGRRRAPSAGDPERVIAKDDVAGYWPTRASAVKSALLRLQCAWSWVRSCARERSEAIATRWLVSKRCGALGVADLAGLVPCQRAHETDRMVSEISTMMPATPGTDTQKTTSTTVQSGCLGHVSFTSRIRRKPPPKSKRQVANLEHRRANPRSGSNRTAGGLAGV